jgi:hypothetical protein
MYKDTLKEDVGLPIEGKRPEWEKDSNRSKILKLLLKKPLTQANIIKKTGLNRKTVRTHLDELIDDRLVEKIVVDNRVGYYTVLDEDRLVSEFKAMSFDSIYDLLEEGLPVPKLYFDLTLKLVSKSVQLRRRKLEKSKDSDYVNIYLTKEDYQKVHSSSMDELFEENKHDLKSFLEFLNAYGYVMVKALEKEVYDNES